MPELRKDPIVERYVVIAADRAARPHDFRETYTRAPEAECPFCEGRERLTPGEIAALRPAGSPADAPGWQVRVVPNRFPALARDGARSPMSDGDLFQSRPAVGAHEVIVESPRHVGLMSQLGAAQLAAVTRVYRDRLLAHRREGRLAHGTLFKNVGAAAGASIEHAHSQLIVAPIVPTVIREELEGGLAYHNTHGRCVFCDLLERELELVRIVLDLPGYVAIAPYASRLPLETWLLPKRHASHFEVLDDAELAELAAALYETLGLVETALDPPAYNLVFHTAPFDTLRLAHYHWHIEIIPRVTKTAGFEWGSGCFINPLPPEEAAARLRELAAGFQARQSGSFGKSR